MAFRQQPTYHAPPRIYTAPEEAHVSPHHARSQPSVAPEQEEWILFSPTSVTSRTYSSAQTQTAGRSCISDFGSLHTGAARSLGYDGPSEDEVVESEDGELDSLDSHLHEFREPSVYKDSAATSGPVLPTHDGLGSFRVDRTMMGDDVQQHLYAFERFNPRRVKRRRDSVEMGLLEMETERAAEAERTRRIEAWRMEQSRVLVDEIQRETRRRKQSMSSERRVSLQELEQEDVATLSNVGSDGETTAENESFWNRITKRVIRDLMGIDDDLLSIIFGEALPADDDLSTTPPAHPKLDEVVARSNEQGSSSWEYRLLERIARELGILVSQLTDHPGAFSTYLRSQEVPLPYAGLPIIRESARDPQVTEPEATSPSVEFKPTLQTQPLAIPQSSHSVGTGHDPDATPRPSNPLSKEEWEAELDIKMVFRYLRSRFTSRFRSAPVAPSASILSTRGTSHLATVSTADTAARAARVRQHHPLVTQRTRTYRVSVPGQGSLVRRGSSSCASDRGLQAKRNSGSSRHYWDFGHGSQSVGSGSLIASTGGMGSWGEV